MIRRRKYSDIPIRRRPSHPSVRLYKLAREAGYTICATSYGIAIWHEGEHIGSVEAPEYTTYKSYEEGILRYHDDKRFKALVEAIRKKENDEREYQ